MSSRQVANRYAEALFGVARERGAVEPVRAELTDLVRLVKHTPSLAGLLVRPDIDAERKLAAITAALGGRFSEPITALLGALLRHRRGDHLPDVAQAYGELADEAAGLMRAEARSAVSLSEEQRRRLVEALARMTGKRVMLEERLDPDVLAGVSVRVGDRLIDGSAAARLRRLRDELMNVEGSQP